jgi:glycogen phosphorylase
MWRSLRPERSTFEVPIGHVTNGVHAGSWLAPRMARLYAREIGLADGEVAEPLWSLDEWQALERLDDGALWDARGSQKAQLLDYLARRRATMGEIGETLPPLDFDPRRLTIGFARRFAEYKRSTLLFRDLDRLARLVGEPGRGLQIVFAGKAHPRDEDGKRAIARIFEIARDPRFAGRIAFVEDYDYSVGRHLVQGADLWLNTPRRPLEACGTSGQKAILNGVLHCSTLDGWWAEAFDGENGYAIGTAHGHSNWVIQDQRDGDSLYEVLERQVIPDFYARDRDDVPRRWTARMKRALATLAWRFGADRMVRDYVNDAYLPAAGAVPHAAPAAGSFSDRRTP